MTRGAETPDRVLVQRACGGDEEAFEALFRRYSRTLEIYVRRHTPAGVRRRISAADVLQETRIAAHRGLGKFEWRNEASLRNWLLKIANLTLRAKVRDCRAARRAFEREETRGQRPATEQFVARGASPSEMAVASELAEVAADAFRTLTVADREILRLVREEGLTLVESAERMGRAYEATKKLYGRALARFRAAFDRLQGGSHGT